MEFDRKDHWERVYRDKSPFAVSWYQEDPVTSLRLIEASKVGKEEPLIDVGGGASVLVDRLLARGHRDLSVLDISGQALAKARERLGADAHRVEWFEADITRFAPPKRYRLWHDRAVFHFLTDPADRRLYLGALRAGLEQGGTLILAAFAIGGPLRCSDLPIEQYDAAKLGTTLGDGFELLESFEENHRTPTGKDQLFGFYRLRRID